MAEVRTLGLTSIEIGDVAVDGGMGTVLAVLGKTYKDTAELMGADPEIFEHRSEESDDPEETVETKGKITLKWSIMDSDADTLVKVLGGTSTGTAPNKIWSAPATAPNVEKSVKITPKSGKIINIVRTKIVAKPNYKLAKNGIFLVDIIATILTPTKAATASWSVGTAGA
jgi:hypothetical protein